MRFDPHLGQVNLCGNMVTGNITDGNESGITLTGDSHDNTVVRNTATANQGEGIRLYGGPTQNVVQDNTVTGNSIGIRLFTAERPVGASRNTIQSNKANLNVIGILVEQDSTGNRILDNTALTNLDFDLGDGNLGCDSNAWTDNEFVTDSVAGTSDGGPGAGCIQ